MIVEDLGCSGSLNCLGLTHQESQTREQARERQQEVEQMQEQGYNLHMLEFKVIDTGLGIKNCDRDKLFKLFGKTKSIKGINQNGVGLGLTIVKQLVERMDG